MNRTKKTLATLTVVALLAVGTSSVQSARSEARLNSLLAEGTAAQHDGYDPAKEPARKARAWRLYQLWLVRDKRDITVQVVPFLQDEYWVLRHNAVRILGRTESRVAERHLQKLLTDEPQGKTGKGKRFNPDGLRLALARNRSRGLKGRAKLTAFAKGMGLSFDEAVRLTQKVRAEVSKGNSRGSQGEKTVREMVDMLYMMGKKGENIGPLVGQLTLHPAQKVLLQGAAMPPSQEAKQIVDYLTMLNTVAYEDMELSQFYLMSLGSSAIEVVVQRLREIKAGRSQVGKRGYTELFKVIAWSGDPRGLALLKHFEKSDDRWIRHYASLSREHMKFLGKWSSPFSPNPPTMQLVLEL